MKDKVWPNLMIDVKAEAYFFWPSLAASEWFTALANVVAQGQGPLREGANNCNTRNFSPVNGLTVMVNLNGVNWEQICFKLSLWFFISGAYKILRASMFFISLYSKNVWTCWILLTHHSPRLCSKYLHHIIFNFPTLTTSNENSGI